MTVIFQEKIIYMPYMPPFTRSEKVADYAQACAPVEWREESIRSSDGTKIAVCVGEISSPRSPVTDPSVPEPVPQYPGRQDKHIILCYFHGNGGSVPPRLPLLSNVLKTLQTRLATDSQSKVRITALALSYRGYWTSSGRATQPGLESDAAGLLAYIGQTYTDTNPELILWGQSLGAGVAATATAAHLSARSTPLGSQNFPIKALVLETPFTSIKSMLQNLYPQKWLPYRYLHPFLRNFWDLPMALGRIARCGTRGAGSNGNGGDVSAKLPKVLLLAATRDEVVPAKHVSELEGLCQELGLWCERRNVVGALHNEASTRVEGREAVVGFAPTSWLFNLGSAITHTHDPRQGPLQFSSTALPPP
ncbi:hypothetical protein MBLNU230_g8574t1 [Neophaeotheca triangularis]